MWLCMFVVLYGFCSGSLQKMQQLNLEAKALLILDNTPEHPEVLCLNDKKIVVIFLPPNITPSSTTYGSKCDSSGQVALQTDC